MKTLFQMQPGRGLAARVGKRWRWLLVASVCSGGVLAADGPIVAVQKALIRDKFLTGEVSGVHDKATREALQKFQAYHSLPPTGEIDTATLEALQSNVEVKPAPARAVEPAAKAVAQGDKQFLNGLVSGQQLSESGELAPAPAPAAPAPAPTTPAPVTPPVSPVAAGAVAKVKPSPAPAKPPKVAVETPKAQEEEELPKSRLRIVPIPEPGADRKVNEPVASEPVNQQVQPGETVRPKSKPRAPVREPIASRNLLEPFVAERVGREAQPGQPVPRRVPGTPAPRGAVNVSGINSETGSSIPRGKTVRTRTTTTGPDGRTTVSETTTTTPGAAAPSPGQAAQNTVEAQPRPKKTGLFDRIHIFGKKDDD